MRKVQVFSLDQSSLILLGIILFLLGLVHDKIEELENGKYSVNREDA